MKSIFSKILISFFMLGIFLVPVSGNFNLKNNGNHVFLESNPGLNIAEAFPAPNWPSPWEAIFGIVAKVAGTVIKSILNLIFIILSQIAYFSAKILDFFIFYSLKSDAYRSTFVEAAWGTLRDVANIFFLLGLLYVAIQIVLDIHVSEKKKMIGNIIIMALLVNFSLFATQVVIDTSNVLARVFYNQIESVDETGKKIPKEKEKDVPKSLTLGLVDAFDPQSILGKNQTEIKYEVLTLFALIIVLGYLCYMFLSVSFLFIGRVVSLWIAMIFAPIAFVTRAIGVKIPTLSWGEWLENLIKSAMMAPIFIFFIYVILLLSKWLATLQNDIRLSDSAGDQTVLNLMNMIIPFAIIFTLLMKAKSLAVKYSGDMGQTLSKVGPALGGLALGGAALGTAALGRQSLGRISAKLSNRDGALEYANQRKTYRESVTHWEANGKQGNRPKWEDHKATYNAANPNNQLPKDLWTKLGGRINATQLKTKEVDHAKHEVDDIKKKEGLEGKADWQLSAIEKKKLQDRFTKEKKSDIQGDIRSGIADLHAYKYNADGTYALNSNGEKILENRGKIGDSAYKAGERKNITDMIKSKKEAGDLTARGALSKQGEAKANDLLNARLNESMNESTKVVSKEKFEHLKSESKEKVSVFDRVGAKTTSGGYDIRDIAPDIKKVSGWSKLAVGILAGIAVSLRSGIKTMNMNPGKGQGDLFNDISSIVAAALKNAASGAGVKVAENSKDNHGGGGHH